MTSHNLGKAKHMWLKGKSSFLAHLLVGEARRCDHINLKGNLESQNRESMKPRISLIKADSLGIAVAFIQLQVWETPLPPMDF